MAIMIAFASALSLAAVSASLAAPPDNRSPVQRPAREAQRIDTRADIVANRDGEVARAIAPAASFPAEFRTIDGIGNSAVDPFRGAAGIPMLRLVPEDYADAAHMPGGAYRPSARAISNAVHPQVGVMPNLAGRSDFLWQWGQFLDHDVTETPVTSPAEAFDIEVPVGDAWFDPMSTGAMIIPLTRSAAATGINPRQQINNITAFIDASNVYGSERRRADELRTFDGSGTLKTSAGNLLPFNTAGLHNAPTDHDPSFFLAGDIRASEQVGLTAMHTLFVREHNRLAAQIRADNPGFAGDEVYEHARAIVAAEMQAITYNEFLPALLGPGAIPPYRGYDDAVDPGISNVFATAAYRVGHTMLSSTIHRLDALGNTIPAGNLALADAFFIPQETIDHGIDPVLRGLAFRRAQTIDRHIIDDVRNMLFGAPGAGGFDLASLNIQRGRDHGLGSYNDVREAYGLPRAVSFSDITDDNATIAALTSVYASPDDIDAWTGLLAEPHRPHALVGETLFRVLRDEFVRLRDGDRFWYEAYLPPAMVDQVNDLRLSDIIRLNTGIGAELQENVFLAPDHCLADMTTAGGSLLGQLGYGVPDGSVDFDDLGVFLSAWLASKPEADCTTAGTVMGDGDFTIPDGAVTLDDLDRFLKAWLAGCL